MSHQPMQDMIPFYLNGTLPDAQRRQFEQALQQQPELQTELEEWRVLADAVYLEALNRSKKLPPVSAGLVEALTAGDGAFAPTDHEAHNPDVPIPAPPSNPALFTRLPRTQPDAPTPVDRGRRVTNAIGAAVTLGAAAAIVLVVGLLLVAMNPGDDNDGTPIAAAQVTEEVGSTTEEAASSAPAAITATPRPLVSVTLAQVQPPTAIIPPTMTNVPPTNITVPTVTSERPKGGGAADSNSAAAQSQPGNCYVQRAEGAPRLPIYQFANKNADVIGALLAGEQLETWIVTETASGAFYQVFLPKSRIRSGWVDANEVDLFGPGGGTCNQLVSPTPTDPADVGNLPTAIADSSVCRVSSSTGDAVAILASPQAGSNVLGNLPFGDLALAHETYSDSETLWYAVILPGVTSGWMREDGLILNGNCAALPERADPNQTTTEADAAQTHVPLMAPTPPQNK